MYSAMIAAIAEMFSKLFQWRSTETQHQSEKEVIKDKRDYKRATDVAERIFEITDKYISKMDKRDPKMYKRLRRKFQRYN